MVEGGKIDWACHGNDAATVFNEVKDMDDAIKVAYEFYKKHPKETLIVVTAAPRNRWYRTRYRQICVEPESIAISKTFC